jgi:TPR repeat protein
LAILDHFQIEKNLISASYWFEKAAEQGDSIAINNLKTLQFTN